MRLNLEKKTQPERKQTMKTSPRLTKYEYARLLGERADQISHGAPVLAKVPAGMTNPIHIAKIELDAKTIPLVVRRYLPNGEYEDCDVNKLQLPWSETWAHNESVSMLDEKYCKNSERYQGAHHGGDMNNRGSPRGSVKRFRATSINDHQAFHEPRLVRVSGISRVRPSKKYNTRNRRKQ